MADADALRGGCRVADVRGAVMDMDTAAAGVGHRGRSGGFGPGDRPRRSRPNAAGAACQTAAAGTYRNRGVLPARPLDFRSVFLPDLDAL